jgi:surfeit locus 1 family protein
VPPALAPRLWWGHALVLAAVVGAGLLGFWQVEAWQERRAAEARDLTETEPVALGDVFGPDDPFPGDRVGQPVTLTGRWLGETVFVDGREHEGTDGFWRVDLLGLDDGAAIPVVTGWLATPDDAGAIDDAGPGLTGWLQPTEGAGVPDADPTDDVYPQLRTADLVQLVDEDLYSGYVVARDGLGGMPAADLAALPEVGRFTAIRNLLYGIEWWVFGGFAVFLWWRWLRDELGDDLRDDLGDAEDREARVTSDDPVASET